MSDSAKTQEFIGRYLVRDFVGQGSMGAVLLGFDPHLRRDVAIKTINTRLTKYSQDPTNFRQRFDVESQVNSRLNHPNIVGIYDFGMHNSDPFLVMEFIPGRPLDALFPVVPKIPLRSRVFLLEQIASGLDHAHAQGVIHRDIKPANILVTDQFEAKIVDFGLARLKDSNMTTTGVFLGTPSYAGPEQITGTGVSAASDLFSFGIIAFQLLFGKRPFPGDTLNSILYHLVHSDPDLQIPRLTRDTETEVLQAAFEKMLAKKPEDRYRTASEFVAQLIRGFGPSLKALPLASGPLSDFLPKAPSNTAKQPPQAVEYGDGSHSTVTKTIYLNPYYNETNWWVAHWQKLVAAGSVLLFLVMVLYLGMSGTKNEPGQPVPNEPPAARVAADAEPEMENATTFEPEGTVAETEPAQEPAQQQDVFQQSFLTHIDEGNLVQAEIAALKLKTLGADTTTHFVLLDAMRNLDANEQKTNEALARKLTMQVQFRDAQKRGDYRLLKLLHDDYRNRWPNDKVVIDTWAAAVETVRAEYGKKAESIHENLKFALARHKRDEAQDLLNQLSETDVYSPLEIQVYQQKINRIYTNPLGMVFLRVEPGTFRMGSDRDSRDAAKHMVTISKPFLMSAYEVTQAQYRAVMGGSAAARFAGDNRPVENLSYEQVLNFLDTLNHREEGYVYRLPTEAEWEYACRAGTDSEVYLDTGVTVAAANIKESEIKETTPVGAYPPNPWGFYDMYGNVSEWCLDIFQPYSGKKRIDPLVAGEGVRVIRGGSFDTPAQEIASGMRAQRTRRVKLRTVGFRLVRAPL
ncbi:bifunctional serine/threonine-protein kinase/formylglycine-generating enzyme family protein [Acanthopleuribacter pedis]|uniref:SUMF1/EgtB/PvdO family nonheme iron enzyme n=1 Tax=Acanthopleuribacter pedis TaxID=442870 RepID=A0A8J7Q8W8_9BACT|nr:bifunctional serine/threonine-protein kinase/formylglycine-generating enzyme family protein [Acanthopleuribacter pedis]MBO1319887.1 SUMF1/EgtB/PvdO family nonheme iron enzyme [Acanthopleuribacter pedis]